jgi:hypothetical protein
MSLKSFHIVFITLSIALALGCGIWALNEYLVSGDAGYIGGIVLSVGGAAVMALYEARVIRKFRAMHAAPVSFFPH